MFIEERNYRYFMQLYAQHIGPVAETYAYCQLKNHFHLLVHIKDGVPTKAGDPKGFQKPLGSGKGTASAAFSNFFNAYAKAINNAYHRTGSLFEHPFNRIPVDSQRYLVQLVRYIHYNPQKHQLVSDFRDWPYSSYHAYLSKQATRLKRGEVLGWFDNLDGFLEAHKLPLDEAALEPLTMDDFDQTLKVLKTFRV